jgi:hypothetical protein
MSSRVRSSNFKSALFSDGMVDFSRATFSGAEVNFRYTRFSGAEVDFGGARFSGADVNFDGARVSAGMVDFDSATFAAGTVDLARPSDWSSPPVGLVQASSGLHLPPPEHLAKIVRLLESRPEGSAEDPT